MNKDESVKLNDIANGISKPLLKDVKSVAELRDHRSRHRSAELPVRRLLAVSLKSCLLQKPDARTIQIQALEVLQPPACRAVFTI